jgi:glycosyltransferase involved in cell wall biosynthesis
MLIGIDVRQNVKNKTGIEKYSSMLIHWLKRIDGPNDPEHNNYILYTPKANDLELLELPKNFHLREIPFPRLWSQIRLPLQLWKEKPDLMFVPAHVLPLLPFPGKKVATIHDLAFKYFPESYSDFDRYYLDMSTRYTVKIADKIITISQTTKDDLIKFYGAKEDKIKVIYLGHEAPISKKENFQDVKWEVISEKFKIDKPFLLYIGRIEKKKNIANLVKSFYEVLATGADLQLVLAGSQNKDYEEVNELVARYNLQERVIFTGYVKEEEKDYLLHNAELFIFLSKYEGFGIPMLEAFYAGLPIIASDIPVFQELYSDAAILVNPNKTDEISLAITKVLKDKRKRERMIEKGKELVAEFTWERCARETLEVLNSFKR